jgi:hypothetical protein
MQGPGLFDPGPSTREHYISSVPESGRGAVESAGHLLKSNQTPIPQKLATLAQLVERLIRNQQVSGSIPEGGSKESITYKIRR